MSLQLDSLVKSIEGLERSIKTANRVDNSDEDLLETVRAGVIQHFEVAYEVSWKMIQRWIKENIAIDVKITKKALYQRAAEYSLIADVEIWMEYHNARIATSHTYDEDAAIEVFLIATEFVHDAKQLLSVLEERND